MHVGDKPYVVSPTGQVDLATRGLALDAVVGIVNQLLPVESQRALDEFGAAQYELPPLPEFPDERFTVVAARGGDDLWAEIRRRRLGDDDDRVPMDLFAPHVPAQAGVERSGQPSGHVDSYRPTVTAPEDDDLTLPDARQLWPGTVAEGPGSDLRPASVWRREVPTPLEPAPLPPPPVSDPSIVAMAPPPQEAAPAVSAWQAPPPPQEEAPAVWGWQAPLLELTCRSVGAGSSDAAGASAATARCGSTDPRR